MGIEKGKSSGNEAYLVLGMIVYICFFNFFARILANPFRSWPRRVIGQRWVSLVFVFFSKLKRYLQCVVTLATFYIDL